MNEAVELSASAAAPASTHALAQQALAAARLATCALQGKQDADGYWCGDLTADSTLQSDYILLQMWLHPAASDGSWNPPTMPKVRKAAQAILDAQRPDGGWNIYEPGPPRSTPPSAPTPCSR